MAGAKPDAAVTRSGRSIRWAHTAAIGFALLFAVLIARDWALNFSAPHFTDYLSHWAAGKLTLAGDPAAAYDVARHRQLELTVTRFEGVLPFPYPPTFLLLITPFSLLPYPWALAAWVTVTLSFYVLASRRVVGLPYALSHPLVLMNGVSGQNGFLTTAIFTSGTLLLREKPFAAGAILGLLVIKPQLALLLPVAVIAARLWPAIAGAFLSMSALLLLSLAAFGTGVFTGLVQFLPLYGEMMRQGTWPWYEFVSLYGFLRFFGFGVPVALAVHAIVAAGAAVLTWIAWSRNWEEQVPILAAASLLITPYILTYDALLMIVPMGFWLKQQPRPQLAGALWLLCFLPITSYFDVYRGPNTIPLAAILFLGIVAGSRLRRSGKVPPHMDHAHLV